MARDGLMARLLSTILCATGISTLATIWAIEKSRVLMTLSMAGMNPIGIQIRLSALHPVAAADRRRHNQILALALIVRRISIPTPGSETAVGNTGRS